MKSLFGLVIMRFLIALYLSSSMVYASPPVSENYMLTCSQFVSGFNSSTSERYALKSSIAPADFSGIRASSQYVLESGCTAVQADLAVTSTMVTPTVSDISLLIVASYTAYQPLEGAILDVQLTGGASIYTWNCLSSSSATCSPSSGSGAINASIDFEPGAILQLQVDIDTQDFILSTSEISMPNGSPDSNPTNNTYQLILPYHVIFSDGFE